MIGTHLEIQSHFNSTLKILQYLIIHLTSASLILLSYAIAVLFYKIKKMHSDPPNVLYTESNTWSSAFS